MGELAKQIADWKAARHRITIAGTTFERRARLKLEAMKFPVKPQVINSINSLSPMRDGDGSTLDADHIKRAVCKVMGIGKNDLLGPYRLRQYVNARFIAYWFMRRHTRLSLPHIGKLMGDRDHATVMNGLAHIKRHPEKFAPWIAAVAERLGVVLSRSDNR